MSDDPAPTTIAAVVLVPPDKALNAGVPVAQADVAVVSKPPAPVCTQSPDVRPLEVTLVKVPAAGVVPPIAPGAAKVAPFRLLALRFATLVLDVTENGAPAAVNAGAVEKVLVAENVCAVPIRSTVSVAAGTVIVTFDADAAPFSVVVPPLVLLSTRSPAGNVLTAAKVCATLSKSHWAEAAQIGPVTPRRQLLTAAPPIAASGNEAEVALLSAIDPGVPRFDDPVNVGADIVGLVARTIAPPDPVVPFERLAAASCPTVTAPPELVC